jgi:hypothetical protein
MTGWRRWVVVAIIALVGLAPAGAAVAADGRITLDVAGDGAGGVTVRIVYANDGSPVEADVRLVLTATGESGRTVGPLQLAPAPEGRGFYATGPILSPGEWEVTVTSPKPYEGRATVKVAARPAQTPAPVAADAHAAQPPESGGLGWLWWLGSGLALVIAVVMVFALRRRPAKTPTRAS